MITAAGIPAGCFRPGRNGGIRFIRLCMPEKQKKALGRRGIGLRIEARKGRSKPETGIARRGSVIPDMPFLPPSSQKWRQPQFRGPGKYSHDSGLTFWSIALECIAVRGIARECIARRA